MSWTEGWTVGKVGWGTGVANSWFTIYVGGVSHLSASDQLVRQASGSVNTGADPGSRIVVHSDDRYVAVDAGIILVDTGAPFDTTFGLAVWPNDGSIAAGTVEGILTIYDSTFAVIHEDSAFNVGSTSTDSVRAVLSEDVTIPAGGGYVALRLINSSGLDIALTAVGGTSLVLFWRP